MVRLKTEEKLTLMQLAVRIEEAHAGWDENKQISNSSKPFEETYEKMVALIKKED